MKELDLPIIMHMPHYTRQNLLREFKRISKRLALASEHRNTYTSLHERLLQPCNYIALMSKVDVGCMQIAIGNINAVAYRLKAPNRKLFKNMEVALRERIYHF